MSFEKDSPIPHTNKTYWRIAKINFWVTPSFSISIMVAKFQTLTAKRISRQVNRAEIEKGLSGTTIFEDLHRLFDTLPVYHNPLERPDHQCGGLVLEDVPPKGHTHCTRFIASLAILGCVEKSPVIVQNVGHIPKPQNPSYLHLIPFEINSESVQFL